MSFGDFPNDAELFLYALNHKVGLLLDRPEYAIPIQTKISFTINSYQGVETRFTLDASMQLYLSMQSTRIPENQVT